MMTGVHLHRGLPPASLLLLLSRPLALSLSPSLSLALSLSRPLALSLSPLSLSLSVVMHHRCAAPPPQNLISVTQVRL